MSWKKKISWRERDEERMREILCERDRERDRQGDTERDRERQGGGGVAGDAGFEGLWLEKNVKNIFRENKRK